MDLSVQLDCITFCVARFPPAIKMKSASVRAPECLQGGSVYRCLQFHQKVKPLFLLALGGTADAAT